MKSSRQIAGLCLLALGGLLLVAQRVLTVAAPLWIDVTLLVLGALCVLGAFIVGKNSDPDQKK